LIHHSLLLSHDRLVRKQKVVSDHRVIIHKEDLDMGGKSHPEMADFMVRSSHFSLEPFLEVKHVTLCFVLCLLERF